MTDVTVSEAIVSKHWKITFGVNQIKITGLKDDLCFKPFMDAFRDSVSQSGADRLRVNLKLEATGQTFVAFFNELGDRKIRGGGTYDPSRFYCVLLRDNGYSKMKLRDESEVKLIPARAMNLKDAKLVIEELLCLLNDIVFMQEPARCMTETAKDLVDLYCFDGTFNVNKILHHTRGQRDYDTT